MSSVSPATAPPFHPPGWAGIATCTLNAGDPAIVWRPPFHVLMLATAGHGTVEVDFIPYVSRPGTLLWIRPGQAVRVGPGGLSASVVTFDPALAAAPAAPAVLTDRNPAGAVSWQLGGEDEDAVISEVAQLAVDCERHPPGPVAAELLRHQLTVLLLRIMLLTEPAGARPAGARPRPAGAAGAEGRTYARFRRLLEEGHPHSRRVEDYAEELGCSVRTLTRACLAVTGRTAKQVVDDRVALEARRLLACTPMSVAEVGRHLGFPEPTNFGRFFHREVGVSPGQFRSGTIEDGHPAIPAQRRPPD